MRIAFVGQKGIPATYGGIERHVEELGARLVTKGHKVKVYCRPYYTEIEGDYKGIELKKLPTIKTKHLDAFTHAFLSTFNILSGDIDIVHFHALGPAVFSFLPRLKKIKTVVTVHGLDWQREKWGRLAKLFLRLGEWSSACFPSKTIVVSRTLQRYYQEKYRKEVAYIPNGINIPKSRVPNKIKDFGLEKDNYILFVGRLVPEKGCHYLIQAFKELNTDLKLVLAGESSHSGDYVDTLKKMKDEKILFLGYIFGEALEELYSNAYLFVLPSEIEGLSISLLEAMSYGRCAVTSDIPENLEVVRDYGFSFKNKNPKDLENLLRKLLEDKDLVREKGKEAKKHVQDNYNWDRITDMTEELYLSLLNK